MATSSIEPASGGRSTGLQLRSDLVVTPVRSPRGDRYVIEDPHAARFYHVGPAEYAFLTRLDGKTAIDKALAGRDSADPQLALSSEQAHALCQWASNARLLCSSQTADPISAVRADEQAQSRARWARTNPFYLRVPLVHPDRFMASAQRLCGWLFSPAATAVVMIVWLFAAIQLWRHANAFATTLETLFSPGRPMALILAWIVLKVLHEIGHGIVCRRYGGEVREAGIIFLLLAPVAYVDVTSSWRFRSKWRRIHTSAAGIYVELSIAALAALLWSWLGTGAFTDILANVVIMAGVTTLAFNLNPLMRFDGYYILADLLEINNLYDLSRRHLRYLAKHHLLGVRAAPVPMPPGRSWVVKVYAVGSACWRVVVVVGLLAAAAALFHGAGIVLAAIGVVLWIVAPASRFIVYLIRGSEVEKPRLLRFAAIVAGCSVVVAGLLAFSPTLPASAPGIVEYSPPVVVRALSPGFVARLHVGEGEYVTAGMLLARLANDTLDVELAKLQSSLEQAKHRARGFRQRQQMSEYAQERSTIESLAKRLEEKRAQVEALDVVAPASGTVIRRRLAALEGTYLARGDELLTLGNEQAKRVTISLNQNQAEPLMAGSEAPATIFISGQKPWSCAIRRLLPGASSTPPDPSLCAPNGGPIAAQRMENNEFQFLTPRFIATVELPADLSRQLRSGQRCTIVLDQMRIGLAEGLWRWCQSVLARFHDPRGA